MARANNKYTSINFNHIYDKNLGNPAANNTSNPTKQQPSSSSLYSTIASPNGFNDPSNLYKNHLPSTRSYGRMLVLSRPTPKSVSPSANTSLTPPLSSSPKAPSTQQTQLRIPDQDRPERESDQISLRPLGRTGTGSSIASQGLGQEKEKEKEKEKDAGTGSLVFSTKPDKFVPPHLRPGFVRREERHGPDALRGKEGGQRQQRQHQGYLGSPGRYGEDGRPKSGGYDGRARDDDSDLGWMNGPRSSGSRPSSSG